MRASWILVAAAGCGRLGFDTARSDADAPVDVVLSIGHDEDGDGIADASDTCPFLAIATGDGDGDGVGDACDPEPAIARERLALFATMEAGNQPFVATGDGTWVQRGDALAFDGNGYGELAQPATYGAVRVVIGGDIVSTGGATVQHQLAAALRDDTAATSEFGEINEYPGESYAGITQFDGSTYVEVDRRALASGVHPGAITLETTITLVPRGIQFTASWPGESYMATGAAADYQRGYLVFNVNNVVVAIRYVAIIATD